MESYNSTLKYLPKGIKNKCPQTVHRYSQPHYSQQPKRWTQPKYPSIDEWMNKMWSVHTIDYYPVTKRKKSDRCYNVDEPWKHHVKWKKPVTKDHIVYATTAKSLQSCPTLWDPIDGSPPGSPAPGILQTRTLEWVAISFSNAGKWKVKVKSLSRVRLSATPTSI